MRDYGKVYSTVWSSPTIAGLSTNAKLLAVYLMTCQHGTIAGVFRLPDGYVAEDLQWSIETVSEGFRELFAKGFANRCETTKWVWITKHLEWNPPENPNQRKAAAKMAAAVPDECAWKRDFMRVCGESLGLDFPAEQEPLRNPSQTVPEPVTVAVAVTVENPPNPPKGADAPGFAAFWAAWPTSDRKQAKGKCLEAWKKAGAEPQAALVVAHVERMKASPEWRRDGGQYIPAPLVYLNQRRWEGVDEGGQAPSGRLPGEV